jgi:hypothetical protein
MPSDTGTDYYIYMDAPPYLEGTPGAYSDSISLNFDLVDGSASEYGRVYLDKVEVKEFP